MSVEAIGSPRPPEGLPQTSGSLNEVFQSFRGIQSRLLRWVLQFLPWLMILVTIIRLTAFTVVPGNVMYFSGILAAALSLLAFQVLMRRIPDTFRTLWDRNIISIRLKDPDDKTDPPSTPKASPIPVEEHYRKFIDHFGRLLNDPRQSVMGIVFGLLGAGWIIVVSYRLGGWEEVINTFTRPLLIGQFVLEFVIGYIVGLLAWRMIITGYEIWKLGQQFDLVLQLGHPDRCGGLAPLGNLCLWNALIISTAGMHLGGWIILGPILPEPYRALAAFYKPLFSTLLIVPIILAGVSFFLPLWSVHQIMASKRTAIERQLDQLSQSIDRLARELLDRADELDPADSEKMAKKLDRMRQIYQENQHVPVWPFNTRILAKFITSQSIPLLGITGLGQPILKALSGLMDFLNQGQ